MTLAAYLDRHPIVATAWRALRTAVPNLPEPSCHPADYDHKAAYHLAWDALHHHVDVDIYADGRLDWFWCDRLRHGEPAGRDGPEDPEVGVSPRLVERLQALSDLATVVYAGGGR